MATNNDFPIEYLNKIICGDSLELLKLLPDNCIDLTVTSPPYFNLRDYGCEHQIGNESTVLEYVDNLIECFKQVYRVTKDSGSCWVNIDDKYHNGNLLCIPDRFKIAMCSIGWICRNEIIWHKPNAMPSSAKNRFNNDYEKFYFFTKSNNYYFKTQYEPLKSKVTSVTKSKNESKYLSDEQESSVRQGMNKSRGSKLVYLRKNLPPQCEFVEFIRRVSDISSLQCNTNIKRSKMEHWYRNDSTGFSYPSVDDWNTIKQYLNCDKGSNEFKKFDFMLTDVTVETDDILKNVHKGRIKRAVWNIPTKAFKGCHFATFPEELVICPIDSCCADDGVVLDPFMGSGTVALVSKKMHKNYVGFELNQDYCNIAESRVSDLGFEQLKLF